MKEIKGKLSLALIISVFFLALISVAFVYSGSFIEGIRSFKDGNHFVIRQAAFYVIAFIIMGLISRVDYKKYKEYALPLAGIAIFLLIIVLIPGIGHKVNGARRWFNLKIFSIQPSEFSKIAFMLLIAGVLEKFKIDKKSDFKIIFPAFLWVAPFVGLILLEKDLGTAIHLVLILSVMIFMTGVGISNFVGYNSLAVFGIVGMILVSPNRMGRIMDYFNGLAKEGIGGGYQVRQSVIGIGNGGFFGLGYSNGRQKYFYLPELHTDFIFSVIGEEGGLVMQTLVILAYIVILVVGIKTVQITRDYYGKFLAAGITGYISIQAMMNMAVVTGLIPAKGIPLPLVSYGGSSVIAIMVLIGILLNIIKQGDEK